MATARYLAMTGEEFAVLGHPPGKLGWMDCCFSQSDSGLEHLPPALPPDTLLILTDRVPFRGHDPSLISQQLQQTVADTDCSVVLLDFEKPGKKELFSLASMLTSSLSCPVVVSDVYAQAIDCPVFLSPCPHHIHLHDHIEPWKGREIWLDLAKDAESITVTAEGSVISPLPSSDLPEDGHRDEGLHCHYRAEVKANSVRFTLWRTADDLEALARAAEGLGIRTFVGLWQELA